ncbi:MAG: ROK family protein [Acidimicrobiales bacterium]|nr:ROK family protein [Acidimicrobiales bacterium]
MIDDERVALAIDIGGTKMAAGLVTRRGEVVARNQRPTPAGADQDTLFATLAAVVTTVRREGEQDGHPLPVVCGVGCGGPMTRHGDSVSPVNIPGWRGFPLRTRVAELTGLEVFVDNDAKALALGEGWRGAARGMMNYLAMVVSTGVGGGIVLDGRLLDGTDGNAGHIGHIVVEPDGHRCGCGAVGCLEAEVSGTAIARITGRPASEATGEVIERAGMLVGRAVASVANLLDLRLAVVAGSVALGFGQRFFEAAQREIDDCTFFACERCTKILPAGLGADGPLVGAAAVGWSGLGEQLLR